MSITPSLDMAGCARYILCLLGQKEAVTTQNSLLVQANAQLARQKELLTRQNHFKDKQVRLLSGYAMAQISKAKLATAEAVAQAKANEVLTERQIKRDELDDLEKKLRDEKEWGEEMSAGRPLFMGMGALIAGPVGFLAATVAGYAWELLWNRKKHFNRAYFKNLFEMQSKARTLSREVGRTYPDDLAKAWWNKEQPTIGGFFGRDFGFQHKYQK